MDMPAMTCTCGITYYAAAAYLVGGIIGAIGFSWCMYYYRRARQKEEN